MMKWEVVGELSQSRVPEMVKGGDHRKESPNYSSVRVTSRYAWGANKAHSAPSVMSSHIRRP